MKVLIGVDPHKASVAGLIVPILFALVAIFAKQLAPYGYDEINLETVDPGQHQVEDRRCSDDRRRERSISAPLARIVTPPARAASISAPSLARPSDGIMPSPWK